MCVCMCVFDLWNCKVAARTGINVGIYVSFHSDTPHPNPPLYQIPTSSTSHTPPWVLGLFERQRSEQYLFKSQTCSSTQTLQVYLEHLQTQIHSHTQHSHLRKHTNMCAHTHACTHTCMHARAQTRTDAHAQMLTITHSDSHIPHTHK